MVLENQDQQYHLFYLMLLENQNKQHHLYFMVLELLGHTTPVLSD